MPVSRTARLGHAFLCALLLFGAAARAAAQPAGSARRQLAVSATVLTKCSVAAGLVTCSEPVEVKPALSQVQTLRIDGQLGRFIVATVHF